MVAGATVKCGTPQHSEMFSLHLRVNHAQLLDNALNWDAACSNIFCLAFIVPQSVVKNNRVLSALYCFTFRFLCALSLKVSFRTCENQ